MAIAVGRTARTGFFEARMTCRRRFRAALTIDGRIGCVQTGRHSILALPPRAAGSQGKPLFAIKGDLLQTPAINLFVLRRNSVAVLIQRGFHEASRRSPTSRTGGASAATKSSIIWSRGDRTSTMTPTLTKTGAPHPAL